MNAIQIRNLSKRYANGVQAIKDITFDVKEHSFTAFLGKNGAGKSTTINILSTLLGPTSGSVQVFGVELGVNDEQIRQSIGVVFQQSMLDPGLTVYENLIIRASLYGIKGQAAKEKIQSIAETLGISGTLHQKYKQLSGGQKRKADIARALLHEPRLLILDEPTTGLDPKSRRDVWQYIQALKQRTKMTILLTTHYLDEVNDADEVLVIHEGELIEQASSAVLREKYTKTMVRFTTANPQFFLEKEGFDQVADVIVTRVQHPKDALAFLNDHNDQIDSFEVIQGTIDDVFLSITERDSV
jgi:multidrug/hemolysin transport system ATP-binding protein